MSGLSLQDVGVVLYSHFEMGSLLISQELYLEKRRAIVHDSHIEMFKGCEGRR
jgi:hypothetical protein